MNEFGKALAEYDQATREMTEAIRKRDMARQRLLDMHAEILSVATEPRTEQR
jgi:hypothetical protein